jgi:putative phosphoesterase
MKTLICSDIHDHIINLKEALKAADTAGCNAMLCCGDLCSPFVLDVIHKGFNGPVHIIFGNNDGDQFHMERKATVLNATREPGKKIHLHGEFVLKSKGELLDGFPQNVSFAAYHYPLLAAAIAQGSNLDAVFCGHSHRVSIEKTGATLLLNPGSVMGYDASSPELPIRPTIILLNWNSLEADVIEL